MTLRSVLQISVKRREKKLKEGTVARNDVGEVVGVTWMFAGTEPLPRRGPFRCDRCRGCFFLAVHCSLIWGHFWSCHTLCPLS